jgi:hypothetical protein
MMYLATADLETTVTTLAKNTVLIAAVILIVTTFLAIYLNKHLKARQFKFYKFPLFAIMAITIVGSTGTLFASTIYLNTKSESKGPVHWHADIEFWACGTELELRDPYGFLSNKIGTATYHEHNDKRIHLEGVVVKKAEDASLEKFMRVTGGYITSNSFAIPLNDDEATWTATHEHQDGDQSSMDAAAFADANREYTVQDKQGPVLRLKNGQSCSDGTTAELQTFVYRYDKKAKTYTQTKLDDPKAYIMRDEPNVPPGDCVIVEFGESKDRTDKLCEQYGVKDKIRCVEFGVKEYDPGKCNLTETTGGTQ